MSDERDDDEVQVRDDQSIVKRPPWRPTLYKTEYAGIVRRLATLGLTTEQLAMALGVTHYTLKQWAKVHCEFGAAVKGGKLRADSEVAASLYRRACGFTGPNGTYYPPDSSACLAWLAHRRHSAWLRNGKKQSTVQHDNAVSATDDKTVTAGEAAAIYRRMLLH